MASWKSTMSSASVTAAARVRISICYAPAGDTNKKRDAPRAAVDGGGGDALRADGVFGEGGHRAAGRAADRHDPHGHRAAAGAAGDAVAPRGDALPPPRPHPLPRLLRR